MASLTISQIQAIKEHMTHDESVLTKKFKAKKTPYFTLSISLNELDDYLNEGWEEVSRSKYKAKIQKLAHIRMDFRGIMQSAWTRKG